MVVTHFVATTDALTSSGWLFGSCEHEHQCLRWGSSLLTSPTCPAIPFPIMLHASAGFCFVSVVLSTRTDWLLPRHRCRPRSRGLGLRSRLRVYLSRSPVIPHRIEFKFRLFGASSLRTGILLPVALHGRITPPQFLSTTGPVTLILTGTCTPLRCALSQSHHAAPNGAGCGSGTQL